MATKQSAAMDLLQISNLSKTYAAHQALRDVSIAVPRGSIFGLLGPNGAGKTSLIRIVNQITGPDSGEILFDGKPLSQDHISRIGYLPEERGLYKKMEVGEQALYLARLKGMSKGEANRKLKIWFERFEITTWWHKKVEELSKGMAQKVQFITTVLHEPEFIILDEPFSGFDPINANLIKEEIKALAANGSTIMLSTHNMGSVEEICTHIALINRAEKVLDGPVREVRSKYKQGMYDVHFNGTMLALGNALWAQFELVDHYQSDGYYTARVRLLEGSTVNQLLGALLPSVEIVGIQEVIPSMNDIFINVVGKNGVDHE